MSDRNWEAELAKIDKQLASIPDEKLVPSGSATGAGQSRPQGAGGARQGTATLAPAPTVSVGRRWTAWAKLIIAAAAAAGLMFWPWSVSCGIPLAGFTAATGGVALLGIWSAVGTWRHRLGVAHFLSLMVIVWGAVLGAREVLPRIGYAIPTDQRGASWSCEIPAANSNPQPTPVTEPSGNGTPAQNPGSRAAVL